MNDQLSQTKVELESNSVTAVGRLDYKVAAVLCYTPILLIDFIAPVVFLKTEPKSNKQLRFHAIQGLGIGIVALALGIVNSILMTLLIPLFGFGAAGLLSLGSASISIAFIGASLYGIYSVVQGQEYRLPIIGEIAEQMS